MISSMLATLSTLLPLPYPLSRPPKPTRPLTALPLDVIHAILDTLAPTPASLAALARTSRALHALATPRLFGRVELRSAGALYALVLALEDAPALGGMVRALDVRIDDDGSTTPLLARAVNRMSALKTLRVRTPLDLGPAELELPATLDELELNDATQSTLRVLARAPPVRALRVHCWPSALPASCTPPPELSFTISSYIHCAVGTLKTIELDAAVAPPVPSHVEVKMHGRDGGMRCPCAWCAPVGAAWEARNRSTVVGGKKSRPFSFVRWLASFVGAPF